MADNLIDLPTDKQPLRQEELLIVDKLFNNHQSTFQKLLVEFKEPLILGILFIALSLPMTDSFIGLIIPGTKNSSIVLLVIKVLLFMTLYYVLKNFAFIKNKNKKSN